MSQSFRKRHYLIRTIDNAKVVLYKMALASLSQSFFLSSALNFLTTRLIVFHFFRLIV